MSCRLYTNRMKFSIYSTVYLVEIVFTFYIMYIYFAYVLIKGHYVLFIQSIHIQMTVPSNLHKFKF